MMEQVTDEQPIADWDTDPIKGYRVQVQVTKQELGYRTTKYQLVVTMHQEFPYHIKLEWPLPAWFVRTGTGFEKNPIIKTLLARMRDELIAELDLWETRFEREGYALLGESEGEP